MRIALVALSLVAAGCGPSPAGVEVEHAFVRRSGPTADTLRVARADTLRARLDAALVAGTAHWALVAPSGDTAWAGHLGAADTVVAVAVAAPAPGDWRMTLTPDSAVGVVSIGLSTHPEL